LRHRHLGRYRTRKGIVKRRPVHKHMPRPLKNPRILYIDHERGEDDQILTDIFYKGKVYSGFLPRGKDHDKDDKSEYEGELK
jgi:hypothetical protein